MIPIIITNIVINSAAGNASHTPGIPNSVDRINAQIIIATKPLRIEVANAHMAFSVALRYPEPIMLIPAKRKPRKKKKDPTAKIPRLPKKKTCSVRWI